MADAPNGYLHNLIQQLTRGEEVVKWLENESERLKPLLDSADAIFDQHQKARIEEQKLRSSEANSNQQQKAEWKAKWKTKWIKYELETAEAVFDQQEKAKWREYELKSAQAIFNQHQKAKWEAKWKVMGELESAEAIFNQHQKSKWREYDLKRVEAICGQHQKAKWRREFDLESAEASFDQRQKVNWKVKRGDRYESANAKASFDQHQQAKWRQYELVTAEAIFDQYQKAIWREYEQESAADPMSKGSKIQGKESDRYEDQLKKEKSQFSANIDELRKMSRKAEVLAETFTKREIQRKAAKYTNPINSIVIGFNSKKLHTIRDEMTRARKMINFPNFAKFAQLPPSSASSHYLNYFILFPPGFQVPARRLIALWVAEGLVQPKKNDDQSAEKIAERYLNELIDRKVISVKTNRSGKVKTCWIDDGRRDDQLRKAKEASFLQGKDGNILRLVDHNGCDANDDISFIKIDEKPIDSDKMREVISFLSFNTQDVGKPTGVYIGEFLRRCLSTGCFIWLNVLDLEGVFRPKLPDTLDKLIALKYLGLRGTYIGRLPDSVNKLLNLQVLDMKHTHISVLPRSIWSMEFLRHLYLSEVYRTRFPDPTSKVTLTALQTLWGAFIDKNTRVKEGLDTLLNIRKLGLSCRSKSGTTEMEDQWKAIDKWISKLKYLETLRLKSRDENNRASDLRLTSLEGNQNLSTVYLLGILNLSILCELPVSLTDITLSGSKLKVDPMKFLGMLPNLMILRLLAHSVENDKLHCSRRRFKKLKVLWIWQVEIKDFEADKESLPCLEELEIRSCKNLEKLPDRLRQLEMLEIRLTSMPEGFVHREKEKYAADDVLRGDDQDQWILKNTQKAKGKQAQPFE